MNCCCKRPEDIKGELLRKTQQFYNPYIKPIINSDEAMRQRRGHLCVSSGWSTLPRRKNRPGWLA
ncbi:hypothetical protein BTW28_05855 [Citrobacter freundii]|nr:hypothetical protein BTW28_05855 [Citrobacter freundii]